MDVATQKYRCAQPLMTELCLNKELDRLQTFSSWPSSFVTPENLARWGFYYTNCSDVVRCYFCQVELGHWEPNDVVITEHRKWSPHCHLMTKRPTNNEPIDVNFLNELQDIVPDTTGSGDAHGEYSGSSSSSSTINRPEPEWNRLSVQNDAVPTYRTVHPHYRVESDRLASFKDWPKSIKQTAAQMADAGFFYTGRGDLVTCFACGGSLKDWLPGDDPFEEHASTFSACNYIKLVKPADFIEKCIKKKNNIGSAGSAIQSGQEAGEEESNDGAVSEDQSGRTVNEDEKVHEEKDDVADEKLCKICYNRPFETAFIPCGHVVACGKCASSSSKCPMCNEPYTNVQRIYLS